MDLSLKKGRLGDFRALSICANSWSMRPCIHEHMTRTIHTLQDINTVLTSKPWTDLLLTGVVSCDGDLIAVQSVWNTSWQNALTWAGIALNSKRGYIESNKYIALSTFDITYTSYTRWMQKRLYYIQSVQSIVLWMTITWLGILCHRHYFSVQYTHYSRIKTYSDLTYVLWLQLEYNFNKFLQPWFTIKYYSDADMIFAKK